MWLRTLKKVRPTWWDTWAWGGSVDLTITLYRWWNVICTVVRDHLLVNCTWNDTPWSKIKFSWHTVTGDANKEKLHGHWWTKGRGQGTSPPPPLDGQKLLTKIWGGGGHHHHLSAKIQLHSHNSKVSEYVWGLLCRTCQCMEYLPHESSLIYGNDFLLCLHFM